MARDFKGQEIRQGDIVYVPCKVLAVFGAADRNLSLEVLGTASDHGSGKFLGFDADQVLRVPDETADRIVEKFRLNGRA